MDLMAYIAQPVRKVLALGRTPLFLLIFVPF